MGGSAVTKNAAQRDVPTNPSLEECALGTVRHALLRRSAVSKDAHVKSRGEEYAILMIGLLAAMKGAVTTLLRGASAQVMGVNPTPKSRAALRDAPS